MIASFQRRPLPREVNNLFKNQYNLQNFLTVFQQDKHVRLKRETGSQSANDLRQ